MPTLLSDVRCWGQSGKHRLLASISPFDPFRKPGAFTQGQPIVGFCTLTKCNDDHFPNRLPQQCFGNDSDVPRIFILNFTSTSGPHAQGEYRVFDMEDFEAHEKAVVLVSTKEVVQPSLNGLLLDLLQCKLVHLAKTMITKLNPTPPKNSSAVLPAYQ
jgi:hypothetical protein